jgi:hypothetical protein
MPTFIWQHYSTSPAGSSFSLLSPAPDSSNPYDQGLMSNLQALYDSIALVSNSLGSSALQKSANLSDLTNLTQARSHLGLGSAATQNSDVFLAVANALSELAGVAATARTSLGLGTAAVLNTGTTSGTIPILGSGGLLNTSVLPPLAIGATRVVASQAAMLALVVEEGDIACRSDLNKSFRLTTNSPSTLADWQELLVSGESPVQSVCGKIGVVLLDYADLSGFGSAATHVDTDFELAGTAATAIAAELAGGGSIDTAIIAAITAALGGGGSIATAIASAIAALSLQDASTHPASDFVLASAGVASDSFLTNDGSPRTATVVAGQITSIA